MIRALQSLRTEFPPLLRLALPLVLAEMGWMAMGVVDTMMVGRLPASAESIGAVSLGSVPHHLIIFFGAGMLLGLDTLVSQAYGAGKLLDCHLSLVNGLYLALVLAPLLMGLLWLAIPYLPLLGLDPEVLPLAVAYLKATLWSTLPLLLYFAVRRYLQAMDLAGPILFALISANVVNVAANWALIFGHWGAPAMGVEGSGWATCVSRAYMALFLLGYAVYHDKKHDIGLLSSPLAPDIARLRRLVVLGFPAGVQMLLEIGIFALATVFIARLDPVSLAAHYVTLNLAAFTFMMPLGVSSAAAVRVGHALGRRDPRGAGRAGWAALALGVALMACAATVFLTLPRALARLFTPDAAVIQLSVTLLAVAAVFQLFDGMQIVATGALRGAGDTRTPMLSHLFAYWSVGLPLGYYLCFKIGWGAVGMWIGLSAALILAGLVLLAAWHFKARALPRSSYAS